jgi:hypothetical protein
LRLDYLVTILFDDPLAEHRALGELMFAALGIADLQIMPAEEAEKRNLPQATAVVLSALLRRETEHVTAPLVRRPLRLVGAGLRPLEGTVVGPGDTPIADAVVELPALNLSTMTDHRGRFRFVGAPEKGPMRLTATKNKVRVGFDAPNDGPVTIRIPMEL